MAKISTGYPVFPLLFDLLVWLKALKIYYAVLKGESQRETFEELLQNTVV